MIGFPAGVAIELDKVSATELGNAYIGGLNQPWRQGIPSLPKRKTEPGKHMAP